MGSPTGEPERRSNEGPQHYVTLASFFIGAALVTQAQWTAVVMAHSAGIDRELDPKPSFFRSIDLPVESITWNEAEEFCLRLAAITFRGAPLTTEIAVLWRGMRLPRYAEPFSAMLAAHMRMVVARAETEDRAGIGGETA